MGNLDRAIQEARSAVASGPEEAASYGRLGGLLMRAGDFLEAEKMLQQGLGLDPYDRQIPVLLAHVHRSTDRLQEAISVLEEAAGRNPYWPELYLEWAYALEHAGDLASAEAMLRRSAELDPNYGPPLGAIGRLFGHRGQE